MTVTHQGATRRRKSNSGRKIDPKTSARNARNRLIEPTTRVERLAQLETTMERLDIRHGDRLAHFNVTCGSDGAWETPPHLQILALADAYGAWDRGNRGRAPLAPFTEADMASIVAGDIEAYTPPTGP